MSKPKKKIAFVIAHYHEEGVLSRDLFEHIKYINHLSNNITLVSTKLNKNEIERLEPYAHVIVRQNKGYDFYSYKIGLNAIKNIEDIDHIIFFNSSFLTIDPFKLYKQYLSRIAEDGLYGISSCSAPQNHIQSYFFSFSGRELIQSRAFWDWWRKLKPIDNREIVIRRYEVGMTQWFLKNSFKAYSVYKPNIFLSLTLLYRYFSLGNLKVLSLLKKMNRYTINRESFGFSVGFGLNLTHFLYDDIYKSFSIVKIDLLTRNPTNQNLDNFLKYLIQQKSNKISGIKFLIQRNTNTTDKKLSRH